MNLEFIAENREFIAICIGAITLLIGIFAHNSNQSKRFETLNKEMNDKFIDLTNRMNDKFDAVNNKFDAVKNDMFAMNKNLNDKIDDAKETLSGRIDGVKDEMFAMNKNLNDKIDGVKDELTNFKIEVKTNHTDLKIEVGDLKSEVKVLSNKFDKFEEGLKDTNTRIDKFDTVKEQVEKLNVITENNTFRLNKIENENRIIVSKALTTLTPQIIELETADMD